MYHSQISDILRAGNIHLSNLKPSEWAEKHRIMPSENTWPGPYSFDRTPYWRPILDCLAENHPAKVIAVKKGAQIGFSAGVLENAIGYIISESPGNILFLTGHQELSEDSMNTRIDQMIDSCGLRHLIKPNVIRKKNQRTGDTSKGKEFAGGSLKAGSANNHKLLRQISVRYGFIDDIDAAKKSSKEAGSTLKLIEQRFSSFADKMKLFISSSPELKATSNIEIAYLKGDQQKWHIPCPCCNEYIILEFITKKLDKEGKETDEKAGFTWQLDEKNKLVKGSVKYICQKCGGAFDETTKADFLRRGKFIATAEPQEIGWYSFHVPCQYAPIGMYGWEYYVQQYLEANPEGQPQKEDLQKSFLNLALGECYEPPGEKVLATTIMEKNTREYEIGIIPEKVSMADGNGRIVLVTCACDMNGKLEDARLDYEIRAYAANGSSYSVDHGSIGTFVFREYEKKVTEDRAKFTYILNRPNSVWPILQQILSQPIKTDTGKRMKIFITGIDTGYLEEQAFIFIDKYASQFNIVGLKGSAQNKYTRFGVTIPNIKPSVSKKNLYILEVNQLKDQLSNALKLNWDRRHDESQPEGFINFPLGVKEKYHHKTFFSHLEAEERIIQSDSGSSVGYKWEKKNSTAQNHYWDTCVYNLALRDILLHQVFKGSDIKNPNWNDYVTAILKTK